MTDRPTPETDALYLQHPLYEDAAHQEDLAAWLDHARDLERRLAEAKERAKRFDEAEAQWNKDAQWFADELAALRAERDRLREAVCKIDHG